MISAKLPHAAIWPIIVYIMGSVLIFFPITHHYSALDVVRVKIGQFLLFSGMAGMILNPSNRSGHRHRRWRWRWRKHHRSAGRGLRAYPEKFGCAMMGRELLEATPRSKEFFWLSTGRGPNLAHSGYAVGARGTTAPEVSQDLARWRAPGRSPPGAGGHSVPAANGLPVESDASRVRLAQYRAPLFSGVERAGCVCPALVQKP